MCTDTPVQISVDYGLHAIYSVETYVLIFVTLCITRPNNCIYLFLLAEENSFSFKISFVPNF